MKRNQSMSNDLTKKEADELKEKIENMTFEQINLLWIWISYARTKKMIKKFGS